MFQFGSASVDFVPDDNARSWISEGLTEARRRLGAPATQPRILTKLPDPAPNDLDSLFEFICSVQAQVGQDDVEFALVEIEPGRPPVPAGFEPLGDPREQMLHAFHRAGEYILLLAPAVFRLPELAVASAARELGRLALHRVGGHAPSVESSDYEADAELAAVALGLGVWIANGAYVFENACCGGGCGIDLSRVRAGLSLPEACFALALDGHRRGLSRRVVHKHLAATQRAALKASWRHVQDNPPPALASPTTSALER